MLLVKTYLAKSEISGNGIFAAEFISKDTVIWDFHVGIDKVFLVRTVKNARHEFKDFLEKYCYLDNDNFDEPMYVLCVDDARFMNHAKNANTSNGNEHQTIANRDIQIGEEITCDYFEIDDDADFKLNG